VETPIGAKRLADRIWAAARGVCKSDDYRLNVGPDFHACVQTAVQQAARELNVAGVTQALGLSATFALAHR
jgi:UrcA family protein